MEQDIRRHKMTECRRLLEGYQKAMRVIGTEIATGGSHRESLRVIASVIYESERACHNSVS